ncbi:MAG: 50S ribosomal protein L6 [Candidatus Melainabacteria bacterium GWF2_37_15]|nr:MAG: 50S ribosomal protein L6 [Candidatus Melainabacteria bacterium GWF2_37_15]
MSRIGKAPVEIPNKVNVEVQGNTVKASGPLGNLEVKLRPEIKVEKQDNKLIVSRVNDERKSRALHGLSRTLVSNMVNGVSSGFQKRLEIQGVGYRATLDGRNLNLALGYSHPVRIEPPAGIEIKVEGNNKIVVVGADKQLVGDIAALIRSKRPPEVYKGKGIRYEGEYVRRKAGKAGKK